MMSSTYENNFLPEQVYSIEQPTMVLLVGPNGAGKTTFRQLYLDYEQPFNSLIILNWDDTIREMQKRTPELPIKTIGRMAGANIIETQNYCFSKNYGFIYETTGADHRHYSLIKKAQEHNYKLVTIFIGLKSPELSKERVQKRVEQGGHNVPVKDIETRYPKIMANFPHLFTQSDTCFVIDNSGKNYNLILLKSNDLKITFSRFPRYLKTANFDLTQEVQSNGSGLLSNTRYQAKTPEQKKQIIQSLLQIFSMERA